MNQVLADRQPRDPEPAVREVLANELLQLERALALSRTRGSTQRSQAMLRSRRHQRGEPADDERLLGS